MDGKTGELTPFGEKWSAEAIDLAYQTWVGPAARSMAVTQRLLGQEYGIQIPRTSLETWRKRYDWIARAFDDEQAMIRDPATAHVQRLQVAGSRATRLLDQVQSGALPPAPDLELRVKVAMHLEAAARRLLEKHAELGAKGTAGPPLPRDLPASPEGLEELERQRREQRGSGSAR